MATIPRKSPDRFSCRGLRCRFLRRLRRLRLLRLPPRIFRGLRLVEVTKGAAFILTPPLWLQPSGAQQRTSSDLLECPSPPTEGARTHVRCLRRFQLLRLIQSLPANRARSSEGRQRGSGPQGREP